MLRRIGIAHGEVGLEEIEPGGGSVALGVVARCDQFDDLGYIAVRAEIARYGHEHVGPVAGRSEQLFVKRHRARQILRSEALAGGREVGFHHHHSRRSR